MADNPSIDPGTTPSIPVEGDDVGAGVIRQGVVVAWGAKDASVRVSAAAPMPVVQTGTPALPTGAALESTQTAQSTLIGAVNETAPASDTASSGLNGRLQRIAQRLSTIIGVLPTALGANGGLKIEGVASGTAIPVSGALSVTGTMPISVAASQEVDGHSLNIGALADASSANTLTGLLKNIKAALAGTLAVKAVRATTPAQSSVAGSASTGTLLASNANRLGATITNESTAILYVKLGATASLTSYTVQLPGSTATGFAYYEVPFGYTGIIDALWASATGNARITELT